MWIEVCSHGTHYVIQGVSLVTVLASYSICDSDEMTRIARDYEMWDVTKQCPLCLSSHETVFLSNHTMSDHLE